jgi:hypothetical protein
VAYRRRSLSPLPTTGYGGAALDANGASGSGATTSEGGEANASGGSPDHGSGGTAGRAGGPRRKAALIPPATNTAGSNTAGTFTAPRPRECN